MRTRVMASLYIPRFDRLFKIGDEVDVPIEMVSEYKGYFHPIEKTALAPENKMITPAKEFIKTKTVAKKGKK